MKKLTTISLFIFWALVTALLIAGLVFYQNNKPGTSTSGQDTVGSGNPPVQLTLDTKEISQHNLRTDCWLIINNKVYNVTGYLSIHPGGVGTITPYCGKEATQAFNTKDIGRPHSTSANSLLADYYIGNLNQVINPAQTNNVNNNPAPDTTPAQSSQTNQPPANTPSTSNVNLSSAEIAKHNTTADCWLIISNKVYGVTSYLRSHPGGVGAISPYCGKDATQAFTGLPHSAFANSLLSSYLLGNVGQQISGQQVQNVSAQPQNIQSSGRETEYEDD